MSRLYDLIADLCPNGVKYLQIGDVAEVGTGSSNGNEATDLGEYPFFIRSQAVKRKNEYEFDDEAIIIPGEGGIGEIYHYINGKYALHQRVYRIHFTDDSIYTKFVLHYMRSYFKPFILKMAVSATVTSIRKPMIEKFRIPVPPMPVQREIVRILDNFTELTEELTAELTARKKQYEYYRDLLIEEPHGDTVEVRMGDVLTFLNGRAYKQEELLDNGKYPVLRVGNFYTNDSWYYSNLELDENKYCNTGDLLYSWAATLGPKIWDGGKCIFHYHIWKILFDEATIDKEYLYYYLQYDLSKIARSTTKSTMIHVSMGSMKERSIILPRIEEQRRIAKLISSFDKLCGDIKEGLPAEISVRQKQYEYYRDKLLTFKEA